MDDADRLLDHDTPQEEVDRVIRGLGMDPDALRAEGRVVARMAKRIVELERENFIMAAAISENDRCEGCDRVATRSDSEGTPLCVECWDECALEAAEDKDPAPTGADGRRA